MGVSYSIACRDCKECLWVGQRNAGSKKAYLFLHQPGTMKQFSDFLVKHRNCSMGYAADSGSHESLDLSDYDDLTDYGEGEQE